MAGHDVVGADEEWNLGVLVRVRWPVPEKKVVGGGGEGLDGSRSVGGSSRAGCRGVAGA
jgi:hypothetical protein